MSDDMLNRAQQAYVLRGRVHCCQRSSYIPSVGADTSGMLDWPPGGGNMLAADNSMSAC